MTSYFDMIVYDMFALQPNEFVRNIQPYRDGTVADQLISTRHMWSETFTLISSDYDELADLLQQITETIGNTNARFAGNPNKQIEPYAMRQFKLGEFLDFLQSGRNTFKNTIEAIQQQMQVEKDPWDMTPEEFAARIPRLQWIKSDYQYEKDEFKRVAKHYRIDLKKLEKLYSSSKPVKLTDDIWMKMQNTDSWTVKNMKEVDELSRMYGRDYKKLILEMTETLHKVYCPIVLHHRKQYHLIAGNTRLMICRVMQIQPQIVIVEIGDDDDRTDARKGIQRPLG